MGQGNEALAGVTSAQAKAYEGMQLTGVHYCSQKLCKVYIYIFSQFKSEEFVAQ